MGDMATDDVQRCREVLVKEHKAHVDGLKYEGSTLVEPFVHSKTGGGRSGQSGEQLELLHSVGEDLDTLTRRAVTVFESLEGTRFFTRQINALVKQLGGESIQVQSPRDEHTSGFTKSGSTKGKGKKPNKRRDSIADAKRDLQKAGQSGGSDSYHDELEERTGYAAAASNQQLAAVTRAIS
jgi:hypothetical protein